MASRTLSLALYNTLLPVGLLYMAPAALVKMRRRGGSWRDFGGRFGFLSTERQQAIEQLHQPPNPRPIWMHAVSVGEIGVAKKLIAELLKQAPAQGIVLTTTTPTGHRLALEIEQSHPQRVVALYSPVDLPFVAKRMLDAIRPAQIVLVEAEVWPNLLAEATRRRIPVRLVNARLSPRSERRYQKFASIIAPIFAMLDHVCVQEPEDIQRWTALGIYPQRITLTGSIKYDPQGAEPSPAQVQQLGQILTDCGLSHRPLLLAASTHAGEERALAEVYTDLKANHPALGLLIAPRHYERGASVIAELQSLGLAPFQRSNLPPHHQPTDVLVIDSTGELKAWQQHATIVVIGKSFLAEGGQNPAEAVMAEKPVVFGPHMENFAPLVSLLLQAKGAAQVADFAELQKLLNTLLVDESKMRQLGHSGKAALLKHQGATTKTATGLISNFEKPRIWD